MRICRSALVLALHGSGAAFAAQHRVPADYATIQAAVAAASAGDAVLVSPGVYRELVNFEGKAIILRSLRGPATTIIDGNQGGPVIRMGAGAALEGFTIRNGEASSALFHYGGGVHVSGRSTAAPATIRGNVITGNQAGARGAGIMLLATRADVVENVIEQNWQSSGWSGGGGGGISIISSSARIFDNYIQANRWNDGGTGAGISSYGTTDTLIFDNVIRNNECDCQGGGIGLIGFDEQAVILQNLIYGNSARDGGGLYWPAGHGQVLQNTIAGNVARLRGSAFYFDALGDWTTWKNNILVGTGGRAVVECGFFTLKMPEMSSNVVYSSTDPAFGSTCQDLVGHDGNLSVDPQFAPGAWGFRLGPSSPAIDAGDPASIVGSADIGGGDRLIDGDRDGLAAPDPGAIEYPNKGLNLHRPPGRR